MANDRGGAGGALPLDLFEAGEPAFVDAIRKIHDADALADFAARWQGDDRPASRRLLLDYLDRSLNAFRHEGLVKRLFKRAEATGDDEVMARFLVLFDRSVRRVVVSRKAGISAPRTPRRTEMPRGRLVVDKATDPRTGKPISLGLPDWLLHHGIHWDGKADLDSDPGRRATFDKLRLFSVTTRRYLRRRAWRYFRRLGREHPGRYVAAIARALVLYRDEDAADALSLLDNWGLVHALFHHSPALLARPSGWITAPGRSFSELAPAPIFAKLWDEAPAAVVGLVAEARSRAVRAWATRRIEADPARMLATRPVEWWVDLLGHADPGVASLAAGLLEQAEGLDAIEPARWLALAESARPEALEVVCELIGRHLGADRVTTEQAARLAGLRALPLARLGFGWLRSREWKPGEADRLLLGLVDADCEPLRPEILRWVRAVLSASGATDPTSVLEFLDSRHADARAEGWAWFLAEPEVRDDRETWRRLLESPHDDVRLPLVAELERREAAGLPGDDPGAIRTLWASVLLNVHRGSRARPAVVRQVVRRLEERPDEAPDLLPLLGLALRSIRGPERRAGLVAVVRLAGSRAGLGPLIRSSFPELQGLEGSPR